MSTVAGALIGALEMYVGGFMGVVAVAVAIGLLPLSAWAFWRFAYDRLGR